MLAGKLGDFVISTGRVTAMRPTRKLIITLFYTDE
jgi:hypothetical protein